MKTKYRNAIENVIDNINFLLKRTINFIFNCNFFILLKFKKKWVKCPKDYVISIGENVMVNPFYDSNIGMGVVDNISIYGSVRVHKKNNYGEFWIDSKHLLIDKKYKERREKLKMKYINIDPFGEEIWSN